jgi:D-aminopeptidase
MKVFLSVDMEGISGLVRWSDVVRRGLDYDRNRRLLAGRVLQDPGHQGGRHA